MNDIANLKKVLEVAATAPGNYARFELAGLIDTSSCNPNKKLVSNWQTAFMQLTPIDKQTVRISPGLFLANVADIVYRGMSSGSRGKHYIYFAGSKWNQARIAARKHSFSWWGINDSTPVINVASRLLPVRPVDMAIAGVVDDNFIKLLLNSLQQPSVIRGYPSRICEVAARLWGQKIPPVLGVICTGENLFDYQRELLEMVFGAIVIEEYGCQETGISGMACPEAGRLHLDTNRCFYEVVDGELVTTDLFNYVMPLVRYKCGDILQLHNEPCLCGRPGLTAKVLGRIEDQIRTLEGIKYPGEIRMPSFDSILNYQVVRQDHKMNIWLQPHPNSELSLKGLSNWIDNTFGEVEVQLLLDETAYNYKSQSKQEIEVNKYSNEDTRWIRIITTGKWADWLNQGWLPKGHLYKTAQLLQQLINPAVIVNSGLPATTKALLKRVLESQLEPQAEIITARVLLFACTFLTDASEIKSIYNQAVQRLLAVIKPTHNQDAALIDLLVPSLYLDTEFACNIWTKYSDYARFSKLDVFNVHNLLSALEAAAQFMRKSELTSITNHLRPIVSILIGDLNFFAPRFGIWLLAHWCELIHGQAVAPIETIQPPLFDKFITNWLMWRQQMIKAEKDIDIDVALSKLQSVAKSPQEKVRVYIERGYGTLVTGKKLEPSKWLQIIKQSAGILDNKPPNHDIDPVPWVPILQSLAQRLFEINELELAYQCLVASAAPNSRTSAFERLAFQVNDKQSVILY
ncbi:MAG: phenylacetate--CoA ligase family protein [Calothrix sp. C42_A2020_038]|nr:phenylacetate--CoA ligase family protein [Calothrix sp. C42_A2020_038]